MQHQGRRLGETGSTAALTLAARPSSLCVLPSPEKWTILLEAFWTFNPQMSGTNQQVAEMPSCGKGLLQAILVALLWMYFPAALLWILLLHSARSSEMTLLVMCRHGTVFID